LPNNHLRLRYELHVPTMHLEYRQVATRVFLHLYHFCYLALVQNNTSDQLNIIMHHVHLILFPPAIQLLCQMALSSLISMLFPCSGQISVIFGSCNQNRVIFNKPPGSILIIAKACGELQAVFGPGNHQSLFDLVYLAINFFLFPKISVRSTSDFSNSICSKISFDGHSYFRLEISRLGRIHHW